MVLPLRAVQEVLRRLLRRLKEETTGAAIEAKAEWEQRVNKGAEPSDNGHTKVQLWEDCPYGVRWNIRKLKDANLIRRVGPDKGGHWEVA